MQSFHRKHKLKMRSSTDDELVSVDDTSVYILWKLLFIEWQWYNINKNMFYRYKNNSILLGGNGKNFHVREFGRCLFVNFYDRSS